MAIPSFRKQLRFAHLWLGLISGLVFLLVCLSGALIVFTEEGLDVVNRAYLHVPRQAAPKAGIERVLANYRRLYPQEQLFLVNAYREENRTYDFFSAVKTGKDEFAGFKMVYANPYTGQIVRVDKGTLEFFIVLIQLHTNLFMGKVGNYIIKVGTLVFFVQIVGGLVLWWPRNRNARRSAFGIRLRGNAQRRTYDLHRGLGFYACLGLLSLVGTGLFMAWPFIARPITAALGGKAELVGEESPKALRQLNVPDYSFDKLLARLQAEQPRTEQFTFFMPEADSVTVLQGRTHHDPSFLNFAVGEAFYVNRYTGEPMGGPDAAAYKRNNQIAANNFLIHMGFWGGMTTKLLTFLSGLIGASLPITGYRIWRGRRKSRQGRRQPVAAPAGGRALHRS